MVSTVAGSACSPPKQFDTELTQHLIVKIIKSIPTWGVILLALISVPSYGQADLTGIWANRGHMDWLDHGRGPDLVDYPGIPINDAARAKALSYMASLQAEQERQCEYYTPAYVVFGPFGLNIWTDVDPTTGKIVDYKMGAWIDKDITTIWMDGRPHPSKNAFHPYSGFTTGVWEGDTLTAYSTHVKAAYNRRNGVPSSDQVTLVEHIVRHGDILAIMGIIQDPIYLTEPFVMASIWEQDPHANVLRTSQPCEPILEDQRLEDGTVPLVLYLRNAADQIRDLPEARVFLTYQNAVQNRTAF